MNKPRITVLGSFIVDLMARAPHLPRSGETVKGYCFMVGPGGKGSNQGVAASKAGAEVDMVTKIGPDQFGQIALDSFRREGMHTCFVMEDDSVATGIALIMVDEATGENQILVAPGACSNLTEADIEKARPAIEANPVFLTQLETNLDAMEKATRIASAAGATIILNPAPVCDVPDSLLELVDILIPNEVEACSLSGIDVVSPDEAEAAAKALMRRGARSVIVTLGGAGALAASGDEVRLIPGLKVDVVDTTGAGDAFSGALAAAIAEGKGFFQACEFANVAASLSVTRMGTAVAMPDRGEIDRAMREIPG